MKSVRWMFYIFLGIGSILLAVALADPAPLLGIHLTTPDVAPYRDGPWSPAEQEYEDTVAAWNAVERGYSAIQSTRPQTLGYALSDSPAGLAAWMLLWVGLGIGFAVGAFAYAAFAAYAHQLQHEHPELVFWMARPVHTVHHKHQQWRHNFGIADAR